MSNSANLIKCVGLFTHGSELSLPEGSLKQAINVNVDEDGVITPRRGLNVYKTPALGDENNETFIKQLMEYKKSLIRHYENRLEFEDVNGVFVEFEGEYAEVQEGTRIKFKESNSNLYFTASSGIKRISTKSLAELNINSIEAAGGAKAGYLEGRTNSIVGGFLPPQSKVAYKILYGKKDANGNLLEGVPSNKVIITNYSQNVFDNEVSSVTFSDQFSEAVFRVWDGEPDELPADADNNQVTDPVSKGEIVRYSGLTYIAKQDQTDVPINRYKGTGVGGQVDEGLTGFFPTGTATSNDYWEYFGLVKDGDHFLYETNNIKLCVYYNVSGEATQPDLNRNVGASYVEVDVNGVQSTSVMALRTANAMQAALDDINVVVDSAVPNKVNITCLEENDIIGISVALDREGSGIDARIATLTEINGTSTEGSSASCTLTSVIPQEVDTDYFIQLYRTSFLTATESVSLDIIDPGDEFSLVYENPIKEEEINDPNRIVTITDNSTEGFRQSNISLYTNEITGEGALQANEPPPVALDIELFRNSMFYANTRTRHSLTLDVISVNDFESEKSRFIVANKDVSRYYTFRGDDQSYEIILNNPPEVGKYITLSSAQNERQYYIYFGTPADAPEGVEGIGYNVVLSYYNELEVYDAGKQYEVNDIVVYEDIKYKCAVQNTGNTPSGGTYNNSYWEFVDSYLHFVNRAINDVIDSLVDFNVSYGVEYSGDPDDYTVSNSVQYRNKTYRKRLVTARGFDYVPDNSTVPMPAGSLVVYPSVKDAVDSFGFQDAVVGYLYRKRVLGVGISDDATFPSVNGVSDDYWEVVDVASAVEYEPTKQNSDPITYPEGAIVSSGDKIYRCVQDANSNLGVDQNPLTRTNDTYWEDFKIDPSYDAYDGSALYDDGDTVEYQKLIYTHKTGTSTGVPPSGGTVDTIFWKFIDYAISEEIPKNRMWEDFNVTSTPNTENFTLQYVENGETDGVAYSGDASIFEITQTGTGNGNGVEGNGGFVLLSKSTSVSQSLFITTSDLVKNISKDPSSPVNSYYISTDTDISGKLLFEDKDILDDEFYLAIDSGYDEYNPATSYKAGDKVKFDGLDYNCLKDTTGNDPSGNTNSNEFWEYFNLGDEFNSSISISRKIQSFVGDSSGITITLPKHGFINKQEVFVSYNNQEGEPEKSFSGKYNIEFLTPDTFRIPVSNNEGVDTALGGVSLEFSSVFNIIIESDASEVKNRLYYSKSFQPEAVPALNYIDIGPKDSAILRILSLRDNLFVLKEDGVYVVSGTSAPNFTARLLDSTRIIAGDSAVVLNNQIYCLTEQGIATITDSGVGIISRKIENKIDNVTRKVPSYSTKSFGISYEADRCYILFMPSSEDDRSCSFCFRYNVFERTWTEWEYEASCGLVMRRDDTLYVGDSDRNYVSKERKTNTRYDYAEKEDTNNILAGGVLDNVIRLGSTVDLEVGDVITQTQDVTINYFNRRLLRKMDLFDDGLEQSGFVDKTNPMTINTDTYDHLILDNDQYTFKIQYIPLETFYDANTIYNEGDKVSFERNNYICITPTSGLNNPSEEPSGTEVSNTYWQYINDDSIEIKQQFKTTKINNTVFSIDFDNVNNKVTFLDITDFYEKRFSAKAGDNIIDKVQLLAVYLESRDTFLSIGTITNANLKEKVEELVDKLNTATIIQSIKEEAIDVPNDNFIKNSHGFLTGDSVLVDTVGDSVVPNPLIAGQIYYAIRVDNNTFKLATSIANAEIGTYIILNSTGSNSSSGEGNLFRRQGSITTKKDYLKPTTVTYETYIAVLDRLRNQATLRHARPFVEGDIYIYKNIKKVIEWNPQHFGDPSAVKQIRHASILFDQNNFYAARAKFYSDVAQSKKVVPFEGKGISYWADQGYSSGNDYWGGEGNDVPFRNPVPSGKQKCRHLSLIFEHDNAREYFRILGISAVVRRIGDRGYR